jgi:hypothetical protein
MSDKPCPICLQFACDHSDEEISAHVEAMLKGEDAPYNAGDEEQVAKVARTAKQKDKQADADLKWVMSDARGRRFVWALMARSGIYRNSYLAGQGQGEAVAFYEGERNIGLELLARVAKVTPKAYQTMTQELGV